MKSKVGAGSAPGGPVAVGWPQAGRVSPRTTDSRNERVSRCERAFVHLLEAAGLVSGAGWTALLYPGLVFVLETAFVATFVHGLFHMGVSELRGGVAMALANSGAFGAVFVVMWSAVLASFVCSRRRYGTLFSLIRALLHQIAELPASSDCAKHRRWQVAGLLVVTLALIAFELVVVPSMFFSKATCASLSLWCVRQAVSSIMFTGFYVIFHLIPFKFVFAALQLSSAFRAVNNELATVADGKRSPDWRLLCQLRTFRIEMSCAFYSLTSDMSLELHFSMLYGTMSTIFMLMIGLVSVSEGSFSSSASVVTMYLVGSTITVVVPCEMCQRVLNGALRARGLLLQPAWQRPELADELALFRESVSRDLDSIGDLGLFRLRRSTILSIMATILTYSIVLMQFYITEKGSAAGAWGAANNTAIAQT